MHISMCNFFYDNNDNDDDNDNNDNNDNNKGFVDKHASAIRALNYPIMDKSYCASGYTRASAHTDYGTLTILRSGGPGLQVAKDTNPPTWVDVPHVEDGFVINLGDLMRRWTNNQWLSTLHQVVNPKSCNEWTRRQSIAFFHNVNNDAVVSAIPGTGTYVFNIFHSLSTPLVFFMTKMCILSSLYYNIYCLI